MTIRVIKKYPNRRLYDTKLGTYITLDDIKKLVFKHVNFHVIDVESKKDITQSTLMQIISEQETTKSPIFTTPLLQEFIRFYNEKSQTVLSEYLEEVMRFFSQQKELFQTSWLPFQELLTDPLFIKNIIKKVQKKPRLRGKKSVKKMKKSKISKKSKKKRR